MNMMLRVALLLAAAVGPLAHADQGSAIPVSTEPTGVAVDPADTTQLKTLSAMVEATANELDTQITAPPPEIVVRRGVTEMIPIAAGHVNRFRTPFPNFRIETTSTAAIKKSGNTFFITADTLQPVSLFLLDRDAPDNAITLLLKPVQNFAPVDVKLQLQGYEVIAPAAPTKAVAWETSTPFAQTIKSLFRTLALGDLPSGYGIQPWRANASPPVRCNIPGIGVTPVQHVTGASMIVVVARATNRDSFPLEFEEEGCSQPGVLAVAAWPNTRLAPGESTEIYIAYRRDVMDRRPVRRPSVLATGG